MTLNVIDPYGAPVEIAPGRGNLRVSSLPNVTQAMSLVMLGKTISYARLYQTQPMIAAAVGRLLTWSVRVPLKMYRRTGDDSRERVRPDDHPLAAALITPWEGGSQADLTQSLLGPLLIHGNGLDIVDQGAKNKITFQPADWRYTQPIMPWRDVIAGWDIDTDMDTVRRTVGADVALHVAWWSPISRIGISPLQQLGTTLNIEDAAQRHQRAMLANGARPPSAITASTEFLGLSLDERATLMDQLRGDISDIYAGPENSGRPALLPPGLEWKQVGHTAVEAELIAQRQVARAEIVAVYQMRPSNLGFGGDKGSLDLDKERQSGYVDSLAPPLMLIEQCINAQIVKALLREDDLYVEYDFAGILRGDRLAEVQALREMIKSALATPNEGRALLNLPKSDEPGMDEHYLERNNLWPLSVPYPAKGMGGTTSAEASGAAPSAGE